MGVPPGISPLPALRSSSHRLIVPRLAALAVAVSCPERGGVAMWFRNVALGLAVLGFAPFAFGQAYKWVDDKGVTHYGDKPPAHNPATQVAPPTSSGGSAPGDAAGSGDPPSRFSQCVSQACAKVSRVDPTCRTNLCQEAMSLPDSCHTITCQAKRAEIEKRIAQMDQAKRDSAARSAQRSTTPTQQPSGDAALRARAQERCKANRGVDCESAQGLAPWIREDRPITPQQQRDAAAARRARAYQ